MEVKGSAVSSVPHFIKNKFGDTGYQKWLSALSATAQAAFDKPILPNTWYPFKEILLQPTHVLCDLFYGGQTQGAWDNGRFSAETNLKGIYLFFVKMGSPAFIVQKASGILPTFYKPSVMSVIENEKNMAAVHMTSFPEIDAFIEARIAGWIERALELSGAKGIKIMIPVALSQKAAYTEYRVTWQ